VARARRFLSQRYSDPNLMLQDAAGGVGMSQSHFSTVFAQETGLTFTQYLTALRIGKAKELLSATAMRSSEIAFAVGYNDAHYFSYMFKKQTGMTPSEYRKENGRKGIRD
jgi:two-component system response regulator YesN